jgi:hypothetical protein
MAEVIQLELLVLPILVQVVAVVETDCGNLQANLEGQV